MAVREDGFSSNAIRLSGREWAVVVLVLAAALSLLPARWPAVGRQFAFPDYRLPMELSSDYWMFRQWADFSQNHYRAVVLGDSVVWGQYAESGDTLVHHLNAVAGEGTFANLGVDGLHPTAMAGMLGSYARGIRRRPVLVHLNPLWMGSAEADLQGTGEARLNHPRLLPQLVRRPPAYRPTASDIIAAVLPRGLPFVSWREHLQITYYKGIALSEWMLQDPYRLLPAGRGPDEFAWREPGSEPLPWRERGIEPQDLAWVEAERCYQWRSFRRAVELLRSRGNRVFVLLGPFNTHALTEESRARHEKLAAAMRRWLENEGVSYYAPPALPTELYADASHPLGAGYRQLAQKLYAAPAFRDWMKTWEEPE